MADAGIKEKSMSADEAELERQELSHIADDGEVEERREIPPAEIAVIVQLEGSGDPATGAKLYLHEMSPDGSRSLGWNMPDFTQKAVVEDSDTITFKNIKGRTDPEYLQVYYGDVMETFDVDWPSPGERIEYRLKVPLQASIEVNVSRFGEPVRNAWVKVLPAPSRGINTGFLSSTQGTDEHGYARLDNVISGEVLVGAEHRGVTTFVQETLEPGRVGFANLALLDNCKLKVYLEGKPYLNNWDRYKVVLRHESGLQFAESQTSDDGTGKRVAHILGLKPGAFEVDVEVQGTRGVSVFDTLWSVGRIELIAGWNEITLKEAPTVEKVRVKVTRDGAKVSSGYIGLEYPNHADYWREFSNGEIEFLGVPARELNILFSMNLKRADWTFPVVILEEEGQLIEIDLSD